MTRKIIQIAVTYVSLHDVFNVFALCDDGTIHERDPKDGRWYELDPIPDEDEDEPDWLDVPLCEVFQDEGGGGFLREVASRAIELLDLLGVRTAGQFHERRANYPGTWHRGVGRVRGKGIGAKTAKAMDEDFDAWLAQHENAEGRSDGHRGN